MYQFYYSDPQQKYKRDLCKDDVIEHFKITAIRPTMWEEHCLECSAPLCYKNCPHYVPRSDGRCKRFENSFSLFNDGHACCGQGAHLKFRKWADMMTIIFPGMLSKKDYKALIEKNQKIGLFLNAIVKSKLPRILRWEIIRTIEYLRRNSLRNLSKTTTIPDAFIFHGYSYYKESFNLCIEIYDDSKPLYKTSIPIMYGENMHILGKDKFSDACWKPGNLVKIYPEKDLEVELDILWCDFVQGEAIVAEKPASKVKCMVWDLDNTLWDGTLIETDDPSLLKLKPGVLETIKELDQKGIIQSIASKNDYDVAWPVLEKLGIAEYFLYPQIHWNAKSNSMEQISKKLNIGIDTLAFIDDSAFERNQVRSMWPQIRIYDIAQLKELTALPEFSVMVTEESKKRRAMYRAEEKRNELRTEDKEDIVNFLKKCHLQINIFKPSDEKEILRCYELVVRTNQLNMSGKKYTMEEFQDVLKREGHVNFAFSCKDDFGEYGIVGFGQYYIESQQLIFKEFAMSCRVAGKYVESALFSKLLELEKCNEGIFVIQKTKKNVLLRRTLEEIGFHIEKDSEKEINYVFNPNLKNKDILVVNCEN